MNTTETRFGIASGCKLFTAIAICQLIQKGKLRFDSQLKDRVRIMFPDFNQNADHTSPPNTHFGHPPITLKKKKKKKDEEVMDDF